MFILNCFIVFLAISRLGSGFFLREGDLLSENVEKEQINKIQKDKQKTKKIQKKQQTKT